MKIIIVNKDHAQARSFTLGGWTRAFLSVCLLGIPTFVGASGYSWLVSDERDGFFNSDSQEQLRRILPGAIEIERLGGRVIDRQVAEN